MTKPPDEEKTVGTGEQAVPALGIHVIGLNGKPGFYPLPTDPYEDFKFLPPFARDMLLPLLTVDVETRARDLERLQLPRFERDGFHIAMVRGPDEVPEVLPREVHAAANHIVKVDPNTTAASGAMRIPTTQVFVSEVMARAMGALPPRTGPPNRAARRKGKK